MVTNVERGHLVGCNLCNVSTARSQCVDVPINIRWIREKVMCIPQDQCSRSHLKITQVVEIGDDIQQIESALVQKFDK